ncbi:MAG: WD40 repeat domain-containing protein, partial [Candidatus Poribacteria bacterium]|nr:WD40 repeat domain-containing protein [Candidatus Poribacteria bacterium]
SPDGQTLATSGYKGIVLWSTNTGELKHRLDNTGNTFRLDFNANGKILASSKGKDTLFWNTETGKISLKFKDTSERTFLAFSPDGKSFATVGKDYYTVQLWDVHTGKLKNTFEGAPVYRDVILTNEDGSRKKVKKPTNRVKYFAFSPDGNTLAVSYLNQELVLWNVLTGQRETTLEGLRNVYHLLFSPDGHTLIAMKNANIYLCDIDTENTKKSELKHIITEHYTEVKSIALSPNGQNIASGHERSLQVWDLATGKQKKPNIQMHYLQGIHPLVYSPDGKILAGYNPLSLSIIILWDTISGHQITVFKAGGKSSRNGNIVYHTGHIAFSPDGKTLANSSKDNRVRLWDVKSIISDSLIGRIHRTIFGNQLHDSKGHTDKIQVVAFSPNGRILASGSDDKTICLWNVRTRKLKTTLNYTDDFGSRAKLNSLEFSPDGKILASGNSDGVIDLWNAVTTEYKGTLRNRNPRGSTFLTFSTDSRTLASGVANEITLWDMQTLQPKSTFTLEGAEGFVQSIKFSHDGRTLVSGNADGTILIWNVKP